MLSFYKIDVKFIYVFYYNQINLLKMTGYSFYDEFIRFNELIRLSRKIFYKSIELKKQWISINIYFRKTIKLSKIMKSIISTTDLSKTESFFWQLINEFDEWINTYSTFYYFKKFQQCLSSMFNLMLENLVGRFPEKKKSFSNIDNYPRVVLLIS